MANFKSFKLFTAYLIYPFYHNLSGKDRNEKRFGEILKMWEPWLNRFPNKEGTERAIDNSFFFLPYIQEILFPQVIHWEDMTRKSRPEKRFQIQKKLLAEFYNQNKLVRLSLKSELLDTLQSLELRFLWGGENFQVKFYVEWIDAFIFPQHVGFICFKITLPQNPVAIETCNNFLYHLRLIHPPTLNWTMPELRVDKKGEYLQFKTRDLVDYLVQVFTMYKRDWSLSFYAFLKQLQSKSKMPRYSKTYYGQVYGDVFQVLSYGCLDETASSAPESTKEDALVSGGMDLPDILTNSYNRILYELGTITLLSDPVYKPNSDYVKDLFNRHRIALFNNWEALALQNNVMFLGKERNRFTEKALPENIEFDYLVEYLLVSFQKLRLSLMLGELIRNEKRIEKNLKELQNIQDEFMAFQNRFWFNEISKKPIGMEVFTRLQSGLKVLPLYEELKEEIDNLHSYFERKAEKGISTLLNIITFIGLPATLLMEAFSQVLFPHPTLKLFVISSLIIYLGVGSVFILWKFFYK